MPVYAVPTAENQAEPAFPLLGWDVYAVEPYANWLPDFSETIYGWGLEAPATVLVNPAGDVLYRGDEYLDRDDIESHLEQLTQSD